MLYISLRLRLMEEQGDGGIDERGSSMATVAHKQGNELTGKEGREGKNTATCK